MSSEENSIDVSQEVKTLISDIIKKNNIKGKCEIKYCPGSQAGDGYASKTIAVTIVSEENQLNVFLKCALNIEDKIPTIFRIYATEIYFYKTIYPTYTEFWKSRSIKYGYRNVPECYGFNETRGSEIVALENLRKKDFTLFDRFTYMNDEHLKLILHSFAKFHAISFAIKDQRKELHDEFCRKCPNFFAEEKMFARMISNSNKDFVEKLDPIVDKDIVDKYRDLHSAIYDHIVNMDNYLTDYSVLVKGDCWVNNMMVLYEHNNKKHPMDVMLIDWQCIMRASPVHDIQALFYSVSSKETIDNYKYYLQIYHDELSKRIKELGSDPAVLYPFSVFEKEWKDYGLYSLGFSLAIIKTMLCESKNAPTFDKDLEEDELENMFSNMTDNQEEYLMRAKYVVRHMIDIGIL